MIGVKKKYDFLIGISLYNTDIFLENQIINLRRCVDLSGLSVKIKYYDDGSHLEKAKIMKDICDSHGVHYHRYNHHGFGFICDQIGEESQLAKYCLILDSDVFLPDYFLRHAYQLMELRDWSCGVLSYKSIKINLDQCYDINLQGIDVFNQDGYNGEFIGPERTTQLATYTFLFTYMNYLAARGFNTEYLAYYSDSDFCCRLARTGFWSYRLHFPKVFHAEHGTLQDPDNKFDVDKLRKHDSNVFEDYWGNSPIVMEKKFQRNWE